MATNLSTPELLVVAATGFGLAAAVGFRVFLPMLLAGLAARAGLVLLAHGFTWMGSDPALIMFGVAATAEIAAYFIPIFDHFLDVISGPVAVVAGTLLMASTLVEVAPWLRWAMALIVGGGTAGAIHGTTSGLRVGSSVTTGGLANPVLAGAELGTATLLSGLAILAPVAALILVCAMIIWSARRMRR